MDAIIDLTNVKGDLFEKQLSCILTEKERADYSQSLAKDSIELRETEENKKEVVADFAAKAKGLESSISRNSRRVSTGKEYRDVECQWVFDFKKGIKKLIRIDTSEILDANIKVTDHDRQKMLPLSPSDDEMTDPA